jgi:phospholipase C
VVTTRIPVRVIALSLAVLFGVSALPPVTGTAVAASLPTLEQALTPATFPITHFVIIMMENHAYDNLFGTYCEIYGPYCDNTGHGLNLSYCMPLYPTAPSQGCHKEYSVPPTAQLTDIPHGWTSTPLAWNDGAMNNFYRAEWSYPHNYVAANETFSYYNTTGDALFSDMAEEYGLSDNFFSSNMSYSVPNHWFAQAGASPPAAIHFTIGTTGVHQGNVTCNELCFEAEADFEDGQFTPANDSAAAETVDEAYLEEANTTATFQDLFNNTDVSWKYYDTALNQNYSQAVADQAVYAYWTPNLARAETYEPQFKSHYVAASRFFTDAAAGTLPNVSWVVPTDPQSCHPPDTVGNCEGFVASYVNAVENSPQWKSTAVFVTMDEYGGFYDGVAPPIVPALNGSGLGFRVPLLVISPYTPEGYISHQLGYFESFLRTIEWKFGLPSLTTRDATAPLLTEFFDLNATPRPPMQFVSNYTQASYPVPFQSLQAPNSPEMVQATIISPTEVQLGWSEGTGGGPVNGWKVLVGSTVYHLDRALRIFNVTGLRPGEDTPIYLESTDGPLTSVPVQVNAGLSVTFTESGLPTGTSWSVTLDGVLQTTTTSEITFTEPNGTPYAYTVGSVPGFVVTPSLGSVTLNGTGRTIVLTFSPEYPVTFTETGLPNGTAWNVTIGSMFTSSTTPTIHFFEPNGTYSYLVATADREYASLGSSFSVVGADVNRTVSFSLVQYAVMFAESNLPPGTTWYLNVTGDQSLNSTGSAIAFTQSNGTYEYTVSAVDSAFSPLSGSFSVNGAALNETITFNQATYTVTFSESGLPKGTTWYVNVTAWGSLSATVDGLLGNAVSANFTAGAYDYTVASGNKDFAPPAESPFGVSGAPVSLLLPFSEVTYTVAFIEKGLPAGTLWNVSIGNVTMNSTTTTVAFAEPNGTYPFTAAAANGYAMSPPAGPLAVNGSDRNISVTLGPRYLITFTEIGLPSSTPWNVTIGATESSSTASTLAFLLPNGTYSFRLGDIPGWTTRYTGAFNVTGSKTGVSRTFTPVQYVVTFTESGLATGTNWSVTVGTNTLWSTVTFLNFHLVNGSYTYFVANIANHSRSPMGSFSVIGKGTTISEKFPLVTYTITFSETGLRSGTNWSITVGSLTESSTQTYINFHLANGSYAYGVANVANYSRPPTGSFTVTGGGFSVPSRFNLVLYRVTFTESRLPIGTNWSVTVGSLTESSTLTFINFHLANGSYTYFVTNVANYSRTPAGSFAVIGNNPVLTAVFTLVKYGTTFTETGLAPHTLWQVSIAGTTHSASGPTISFTLANGTFTYNATAPGSGYTTSNRSFSVDGVSMSFKVPFAPQLSSALRSGAGAPFSPVGPLLAGDKLGCTAGPFRNMCPR